VLEAEPLKPADLLSRRSRDADQLIRALGPEVDDGPLRQALMHVGVSDPACAGGFDEQLGSEPGGRIGEVRVDALLPAVRALGAQAQALGGAEDRGRLEVGRLEQHLARGLADLGLLAAHDPGERDGALGVGDHQVGRLELPLDAVQGANRLSRNGPADDDLSALQRGQVEGVQRVAEREHDVVGHVHDVGDRAHPGVEQPRLEPDRRGAERHVAEEPADVARAPHEVLDGHAHGLIGCRLEVLLWHRRELELVERCDLTREPVDREQVGPVAGGLDEQHLLD